MFKDISNEIKASFVRGGMIVKLIYVNLAVFIVFNLIAAVCFLFNCQGLSDVIAMHLAVPANIANLIYKPWTVFSYMFFHKDFIHILFNLLWLYWFGKLFLMWFTEKQLLSNYLIGGIFGAVFFILAFNVFPGLRIAMPASIALGASASVMAIVIATSVNAPEEEISLFLIGRIKLKWIAVAMVLMDLIFMSGGNAGGHIAHLGGALWGYLFASAYKNGKDISKGFSNFISGFMRLFSRKPRMRVTYSKNPTRQETDYEYNKKKAETQEMLDDILEKIAKSGYKSLSKKEKELLFKFSKKE